MGYKSVVEILDAYGANFDVEKRAEFYLKADGTHEQIYDLVSNVRIDTDQRLGTVGRDYGNVPYRASVDFLNPLLEKEEITLSGFEMTRGGARLFMAFKAMGDFSFDAREKVMNRFSVYASHDGSREIEVHITPLRVTNIDGETSKSIMLPAVKPLKFRHSSLVLKHLKKTEQTLEKIQHGFSTFEAHMKILVGLRVSDEEVQEYYKEILGDSDSKITTDRRDSAFSLYKHGIFSKLPHCNGSLYGAYAALIYYVERENKTRKAKWISKNDARVESFLIGEVAKKKMLAYATAMELVNSFMGKVE